MAQASTKRYAERKPLSIIDGVPVGLKEDLEIVRNLLLRGSLESRQGDTNRPIERHTSRKTDKLNGRQVDKKADRPICSSVRQFLK